MSGITESPPTYYFSGITFNPNFLHQHQEIILQKQQEGNTFYLIQKPKETKPLIGYILHKFQHQHQQRISIF
jgi:hypothetical protein